MYKHFSLLVLFALVCACAQAQTRYVGGDISTLPLYEKDLSYYKDVNGSKITNFITWAINDCGWNTFRVRIFVNPTKADQDGTINPSVCQDLAFVTALGQRIKAAGAYFMLDFHYSDTWVDATHIQAPAAWKGVSDAAMADSISQYTHKVLQTLKAANATPDLVQVGNEIMYGLCGIKVKPYNDASSNWDGYLGLLHAGCNAVREECPDAQIIIHTDRPTNTGYNSYYYNKLKNANVDFDVIGLSYYPFWHGYLNAEQVASKSNKSNLVNAINNLKTLFPDKRVQIVECAYNFQNWPSSGVSYNTQDVWPCSVAGQYQFVKDLVDNLKPLENVDGISYWFPEEAGNGDYVNWSTYSRLVIKSWQNRGFWNENATTSGHAINKTGAASGGKTAADVCAPYYMRNFYHSGQGLEDIPSNQGADRGRLVFHNGHVLVERNEQLFDLTGARVQ
ncbi:MAG: glycosyl hydrolase 53 family protein [Paludibacteraceae bacterium]|nr:glycosyl hydrolase 53 family protein [Paludibacteraceae bacterium]